MPQGYRFECSFCGRDFGSDVIGLAVHIGRIHDRRGGGGDGDDGGRHRRAAKG